MSFYREKIFPLLAGALWCIFLFLDLTGLHSSTWIKFSAVCLCCLTALSGAKTPDGKLVAAALCFTVGADWFLLVRDDHYQVGIGLFIIVQLLYARRLSLWREKAPCKWPLILRCLGLLLAPFRSLVLPLFYFLNLCLNTAEAIALRKSVFAVGLALFVCCDICVGLSNLGVFSSVTWWLCWCFYLPSQVLIVLSQKEEI